ncbi:hypothetical protein KDA00_04820 [Candidatus Saccharibacteria bacterium]|nr:hypothetical protein [Candidatus Saccharibacteria bacterium]
MKSKKRILSLIFLLVLLSTSTLAVLKRQIIYDWIRLRKYVPSIQIAQLASATTMNDNGKHLFYVNWPTLQNKSDFNQNCTESEKSIVLGCFVEHKGIFLLDVEDERLNGIEEVTAAHEMLHAAYARLSGSERQRINKLTEEAFLGQSNARILKTVEAYRTKDPSIVPNELHSIIATEVRNIPEELEDYYKTYFTNRSKIVDLSEKYEQSFADLEQQAESYKIQLDTLKTEIEVKNKQLEKTALELNTEYQDLESRRESTTNPVAFNLQVKNYNTKVALYNAEVQTVSSLIDQYNQLLEKYNATVLQENELIKAIDSRPETIQTE